LKAQLRRVQDLVHGDYYGEAAKADKGLFLDKPDADLMELIIEDIENWHPDVQLAWLQHYVRYLGGATQRSSSRSCSYTTGACQD
jgi:hypothetical protein